MLDSNVQNAKNLSWIKYLLNSMYYCTIHSMLITRISFFHHSAGTNDTIICITLHATPHLDNPHSSYRYLMVSELLPRSTCQGLQ